MTAPTPIRASCVFRAQERGGPWEQGRALSTHEGRAALHPCQKLAFAPFFSVPQHQGLEAKSLFKAENFVTQPWPSGEHSREHQGWRGLGWKGKPHTAPGLQPRARLSAPAFLGKVPFSSKQLSSLLTGAWWRHPQPGAVSDHARWSGAGCVSMLEQPLLLTGSALPPRVRLCIALALASPALADAVRQ